MKAVTFESLKREIGDEAKAREVYNQIAEVGGFGAIGAEFKDGLPALDVSGLSEAKQQRVEEIIAKAKGEPKAEVETVESLSKLSREKLEERAKAAGLDGNKYTDKKELAKAVLEKEGNK